MKRGTPEHIKMHALAAALKCPLYSAVGIMEMLWHYAARTTPQGDIGSVPDRAIALGVGWTKRSEPLIGALVECRWLDRSEKFRLVIHDWPDHCEYEVRRALIRKGKDFVPAYGGRSVHDKVAQTSEVGAPLARNGAPSREAMAKAKASEELKPTNEEKTSTRASANFLDESWPKFQQAYPGVTATPEDWTKAAFTWRQLDWEQRAAAIEAVARSEPAFVKLPQNYLADREWTRKPRPEPVRKSKLDKAFEQAANL